MDELPIQSPVDQQAHAPSRGFVFQWWLTVDAWLCLQGEERLYVECTEDFAKFTTGRADMTQAKALTGNLTLRSADAIEAIEHLWNFWQQKPTIALRLAVVTTAGVGQEQNDPFKGIAGLTLWNQTAASRDVASAEQLRHFLASDPQVATKLSPSLAAYLRDVPAKDFLEKIVIPLVWDTGHDDHSGVREAVHEKLDHLAIRKFGMNPDQAEALASVLFTTIAETAASGENLAFTATTLLKKAQDFFAPQQTALIAARQSTLFGGLVVGTSELVANWTIGMPSVPIQAAVEYSRRDGAVAAIKKNFGTVSFVVLTGSTGMGKTTLAQLFSAASGGAWLQLNLGGELSAAIHGLQECVYLMGVHRPMLDLIIDDLPWEKFDSSAANVLRGLAYAARKQGAHVVFTNQRSPTQRQLATAGMNDAVEMHAPPLNEDEIAEISSHLGCADKSVGKRWASLVKIQTMGHPQLVHALLLGLQKRNWPSPTVEEFITANAVIREERERTQILLAPLSAEETELLLRLGAFIGPFRRDQALALAQSLEPVPNASATFECLRGPWIEPITNEYYRLSPLLASPNAAGVPPGRIKAINACVVESVLQCSPVYFADAATVLGNAILGDATAGAKLIIMKLLMAPSGHVAAIRRELTWTLALDRGGTKPIFSDEPFAEGLFRLMQFVVATDVAPKKCMAFLEICERAIACVTNTDQADGLRGLLAFNLVTSKATEIPLPRLFTAVASIKKIMVTMAKDRIALPPGSMPLPKSFQAETPAEELDANLTALVLSRATGAHFLEELLHALEQAQAPERETILESIGRCKPLVFRAFDSAWLEEDSKKIRVWEGLLELFGQFIVAAKIWGNNLLVVAAARAVSIIRNEYLRDEVGALAILDEVTPTDPELASAIAGQRGKIALLARRYVEAQLLFETAIEHYTWAGFTSLSKVYLLQNAGTAAGHASNWPAAARHFSAGYSLALAEDIGVRACGLCADAGYALWMMGQKLEAIDKLAEALAITEHLPDSATDLASLQVQKMLGHILLRLAWGPGGRNGVDLNIDPVVPGMCSEPRTFEAIRALLPPKPELTWYFLVFLEFVHTRSTNLWDQHHVALLRLSNPLVRSFSRELQARHFLRTGRFMEILPLTVTLATEYATVATLRNMEPTPNWLEFRDDQLPLPSVSIGLNTLFPIPRMLLCALSMAVAREQNLAEIVSAWRQDAVGKSLEKELSTLLDQISACLAFPADHAFDSPDALADEWKRWALALGVLEAKNLDPDVLLTATVCVTLTVARNLSFEWMIDMMREIDVAISSRWERACQNRYAFKSPTLFIPDIRALAIDPKGTAAHSAQIALAAVPAVTSRWPAKILDELRTIAAGKL
ncbi:MAG: hypothetical protein ABSE59_11555 [Opitutaceae bacterium]|jgi:hypothetical protein